MLTIAERFCDAMNARRIVEENAFDDAHAETMYVMLQLQMSDIDDRYMRDAVREAAEEQIHFPDDSIAAAAPGDRWEVVPT